MSEQEQPPDQPGAFAGQISGPVILGFLLVATGAALLLDRMGVLPTSWRLSLWPVLLVAYGVARLAQPRSSGREGLFFVIAGAWWFAGISGWLSLARTWPVLIVAAGASMVLEAATASRSGRWDRHDRLRSRHTAAGWIVPLILIGAVLSADVDRHGLTFGDTSRGQFHAFSVMSKRAGTVPPSSFEGGDLIAVMGSNSIDLRQLTMGAGADATINVVTMMGDGVIIVPADWAVDVRAVPIMGTIANATDHDSDWSVPADAARDASAGTHDRTAPHVTIRGVVMMGRLTIRSVSPAAEARP